ncbi:MAG: cache domain-containing protein [Arcobacteraceae bacterium]
MKLNYDVSKLIRLIKSLPIAIAIIFSCITTYLVVNNNIEKHQETIKNLKADFLKNQKTIIQKEVLRTVKQINYQKNLAEKKLKDDIKTRVETVTKIIHNIYNENKDKTEQEIKKLVNDAIRPIRFNEGRGYFFIYAMNGINILHATTPEYEGKNLWNVRDQDGSYTIQELTNIAKMKKQGYFTWYWSKPTVNGKLSKDMYKKIGYVQYISELDWFVGTGEYVVDFENNIKKELIKEIQEIRFGKNGYIFMHQYDGLCLTNIDTTQIGKYNINVQNDKGQFILKDIIDIAKKGSGFIEYEGVKNPFTKVAEKKLSYVVGMDDWQWQIGAGTYIDEINRVVVEKELEFKEKLYSSIISIIISSIILTLILIYIMLKLLTVIETEFAKYEKALSDHIHESHKKDKLLSEQAKLASMGEMIANIAHQWRQPLSVISTAATGMKMQKEFGCLPDHIFNNSCDAINNNAQYLSATIDDFKNFIKGNNKSISFDVSQTINSFLHLVESSIKTHNIEVILDLEENLIVKGHENEVTQCLMNIFNNSKDALHDNKIKHKEFSISTKKDNEFFIIEIKDNAGGIPKDVLPKIFEPYFTTKHKSQGTGLGLHMTYNLITEGMKGTIVASTVAYKDKNNQNVKGALFTITLPIQHT